MENTNESIWDKRFENLTLADDFVFKLVLENEAICKRLIEMVLHRRVKRVVSLETEKTLSEGFFSHSVRFDVYIESSDEVIDFEIQKTPQPFIARRARDYQANLDVELIRKGQKYSALKETWIVFFCTFDPFGLGRPVYTVEQVFKEDDDKPPQDRPRYNDGTHKVFYNCPVWAKCTDAEIAAFMKLIDGKEAETDFARTVVRQMQHSLKREDVRRGFMRLQEIVDERVDMRLQERMEQIKPTWLAQGIAQGRDEGAREKALSTARNFLAMGLTPQQVAQGVGLSVDEVMQLT